MRIKSETGARLRLAGLVGGWHRLYRDIQFCRCGGYDFRTVRTWSEFEKRPKIIAQKAAVAIPAQAVIVSADSYAKRSGGKLTVTLGLKVQPPTGNLYDATTTWEADFLATAHLQPGQSLAVKIDKDDPNVIYPNVPWANYVGPEAAIYKQVDKSG